VRSALGREQASYRRGFVLGFTMAEIFVLIVFCLLLIWMIGVKREATRAAENVALRQQLADVEAKLEAIVPSRERKPFDDLFTELRRAQAQVADLSTRVTLLEEAKAALDQIAASVHAEGASPGEVAKRAEAQLRIGESVLTAAGGAGFKGSESELRQTLAALAQIRDDLQRAGLDPAAAAAAVDKTRNRLDEVEGRLGYAQRQLQELGRGTEWPACWADDAGKPEYIFDVALTSRSLLLRGAVPPHRRESYAALPVASIPLGADLTLAAFRDATRPLFEWSERERCRFFVRVFDTTEPTEKGTYKLHLRTVGERFYYYEELRLRWSAGSTPPGP
jgi:hypothetical protein